MTQAGPVTVSFRFDAATPEDAQAVITAIREAGIVIVPHHTCRPKRGDAGVFWDGQIVVDGPAAPMRAEAPRSGTGMQPRPTGSPARRPTRDQRDGRRR